MEGIAALPVSGITAALLTALLMVLALRVISIRRGMGVSLGTGDNEMLTRAVRGHGNCAEYAPFGILLLGLAEIQGGDRVVLATLAAALIAGRLAHGYALAFSRHSPRLRFTGMILTLSALGLLAIFTLLVSVRAF